MKTNSARAKAKMHLKRIREIMSKVKSPLDGMTAVSYTHLTLPTILRV